MSLAELLSGPKTGIDDVVALLDALDDEARWSQLSTLDRGDQRQLYQLAVGRAVGIGDLVGAAADLAEVIHDGRNTLPLPGRLRTF